jgi:hypothetical protein
LSSPSCRTGFFYAEAGEVSEEPLSRHEQA